MVVCSSSTCCSVELADGYYCELHPLPPPEHFVLRESQSPRKVRISVTVTPLGNVLQETAKKSVAKNI